MAAEEETPAFINYGEPGEASPSEGSLVIHYFKDVCRIRGISWLPTVKERTLAKRMVKEYGQLTSETIIDFWFMTAKAEHKAKFNYMYNNRHLIAKKCQRREDKDYGFET